MVGDQSALHSSKRIIIHFYITIHIIKMKFQLVIAVQHQYGITVRITQV